MRPSDLVCIIGEMNALDHGAALEHRGRALQLEVFCQCDAVALGEQRARQILLRISCWQQLDERL